MHGGFYNGAKRHLAEIATVVRACDERAGRRLPVWVTGHSLGGGYANALALHLLAQQNTAELFGAGTLLPGSLRCQDAQMSSALPGNCQPWLSCRSMHELRWSSCSLVSSVPCTDVSRAAACLHRWCRIPCKLDSRMQIVGRYPATCLDSCLFVTCAIIHALIIQHFLMSFNVARDNQYESEAHQVIILGVILLRYTALYPVPMTDSNSAAGGGTVTFGAPMVVYSERPASMYSQLQVTAAILIVTEGLPAELLDWPGCCWSARRSACCPCTGFHVMAH